MVANHRIEGIRIRRAVHERKGASWRALCKAFGKKGSCRVRIDLPGIFNRILRLFEQIDWNRFEIAPELANAPRINDGEKRRCRSEIRSTFDGL